MLGHAILWIVDGESILQRQVFALATDGWREVQTEPALPHDQCIEFVVDERAQLTVAASAKNALASNAVEIRGDEAFFIRYLVQMVELLEGPLPTWQLGESPGE
ncbi:hypothetical protein [Curtobacterium sp. UCD-KPL2560]|uniref:hypothetical protein n=1 Tax=Curtobacterium sp. UCD-KPL2560 TaxID=1885315 RepID=UPI00114CE9C7|nr:hypothetical protein [Curtobacterium sp. UCD-KPL2560]